MSTTEIRYCTSADGTRIAFTTFGRGEPALLIVPGWAITFELEAQFEEGVAFYEKLSRGRMVVRYDLRGMGASARDVGEWSVDAQVGDAEAVARAIGLGTHDLMAVAYGSPIGIRYAARHRDQIRKVVLWAAYAAGREYTQEREPVDAFVALMKSDWRLATRVMADVMFPKGPEEYRRRWSRTLREATTAENASAFTLSRFDQDVSGELEQITHPVLAMNRRGNRSVPVGATRELAARLPNARFMELPGEPEAWFFEHESYLDKIIDFLDDRERPDTARKPDAATVRTVLFTDIVGHTEMMSRLGDARGRDVLREHERITRDVLKRHGGQEVKTMGDGFMASFGSVTAAMECAIDLQRAFDQRSEVGNQKSERVAIRVGLNAGEPIEEDGDLFGSTVILASRICARAGVGEILVPETVRGLLSGKGFVFGDRGEFVPKGFDEGVRVFDVRWRNA